MTETPKQRSEIMRRVKDKDTGPEMVVRRLIHSIGYRYRLHRTDLPGKPDLVFSARRKVIFVHGCFWHGHNCKRGSRVPKTNTDYWQKKIARNKERDAENRKSLNAKGWTVLTVWECRIKEQDLLVRKIVAFLNHCDGKKSDTFEL